MVARIARSLLLLGLLAVLGVLWHALRGGLTPAGCIVLGLLLLAQPGLVGVEMLLARRIGIRVEVPPPSLRALTRAWAGEWWTSARVFAWDLPWRSHAMPDHLPGTARGRRGVVFIHGFVCNRGIWNPWLERLIAWDRAFVAVNLEPLFGSIDDYCDTIEAAVQRVQACTGLPPVVVAHSMGGLAARAWLRGRTLNATTVAPHHVLTLATPHRGTWLAQAGLARNARQMRTDSDWLRALAAAEPPTQAALFTCWWSDCDQIVFPPPCAQLPGARARRVPATGHLAITRREEIWTELRQLLLD